MQQHRTWHWSENAASNQLTTKHSLSTTIFSVDGCSASRSAPCNYEKAHVSGFAIDALVETRGMVPQETTELEFCRSLQRA